MGYIIKSDQLLQRFADYFNNVSLEDIANIIKDTEKYLNSKKGNDTV